MRITKVTMTASYQYNSAAIEAEFADMPTAKELDALQDEAVGLAKSVWQKVKADEKAANLEIKEKRINYQSGKIKNNPFYKGNK